MPLDRRGDARGADARRRGAVARPTREAPTTEGFVERAKAAGGMAVGAAQSTVAFFAQHRILTVALVVIVAAVAMLYGPVRDCYVATRTNEDLQTRYEALESQNSEFTSDIARLQTREGIEDLARERGFVGAGETSVSVQGLDEDKKSAAAGKPVYEDKRDATQRMLDGIFGYNPAEAYE
jgi:cell division protein FtsB